MLVSGFCPNCGCFFEINSEIIAPTNGGARCIKCGEKFFVPKNLAMGFLSYKNEDEDLLILREDLPIIGELKLSEQIGTAKDFFLPNVQKTSPSFSAISSKTDTLDLTLRPRYHEPDHISLGEISTESNYFTSERPEIIPNVSLEDYKPNWIEEFGYPSTFTLTPKDSRFDENDPEFFYELNENDQVIISDLENNTAPNYHLKLTTPEGFYSLLEDIPTPTPHLTLPSVDAQLLDDTTITDSSDILPITENTATSSITLTQEDVEPNIALYKEYLETDPLSLAYLANNFYYPIVFPLQEERIFAAKEILPPPITAPVLAKSQIEDLTNTLENNHYTDELFAVEDEELTYKPPMEDIQDPVSLTSSYTQALPMPYPVEEPTDIHALLSPTTKTSAINRQTYKFTPVNTQVSQEQNFSISGMHGYEDYDPEIVSEKKTLTTDINSSLEDTPEQPIETRRITTLETQQNPIINEKPPEPQETGPVNFYPPQYPQHPQYPQYPQYPMVYQPQQPAQPQVPIQQFFYMMPSSTSNGNSGNSPYSECPSKDSYEEDYDSPYDGYEDQPEATTPGVSWFAYAIIFMVFLGIGLYLSAIL